MPGKTDNEFYLGKKKGISLRTKLGVKRQQNNKKPADLKVFISSRDSVCYECGENLGRGAWISLVEDKGALCLACADLDHLIFLP